MVPRTAIVAVDAAWSAERILETALQTPYSRLPVYEGSTDNVIGALHARDLVMAYVHDRASDMRRLLRPAPGIPETMPAHRLLPFLREQRTRLAVVYDEFGGLSGLVTLEDVLSELLGEVGDEFQPILAAPERLPDGRFRIPGATPVTQVEQWLDTAWDSEADTLGGYVLQLLGRMAEEGDVVRARDAVIEVERLAGRVPGSLLMTPRRRRGENPRG
jgi:CBS domain containing-hemolysin-like protein